MKSRLTVCFLLALSIAAPAAGQEYPVKPVRLVVPFPAGASSNDIIARLLAGTSVGDLITGAGGTVPTLEPAMGSLGSALGGQGGAAAGDAQAAQVPDLLGALAGGTSTIRVANVGQVSNFAPLPQVAPPPSSAPVSGGGELPRTGGETIPALLVAAILAAGTLGLRRVAKS